MDRRRSCMGWLGYLNKQGLMKPTPKFTTLLKKFDIIFKEFHGECLVESYDPIDQFFQILKSKFNDTLTDFCFKIQSKIFHTIKTSK